MRCWNCGTEMGEGDACCANCGVDSLQARKGGGETRVMCEKCGASVPSIEIDAVAGQRLCPACSNRAQDARASGEQRKQREKEMMRSSGIRSRRNAERFEVAQCFVRVAPMGLTATLLRRDKLRVGPLVDLSRTGLQCIASGTFAKGDVIRIEILAPAFAKALELRGIVRWAVPAPGEQTRMGVQFDEADPKTRAHLEALEKHEALRNAAFLLEERKKSSTASMPKVGGEPPPGPSDF